MMKTHPDLAPAIVAVIAFAATAIWIRVLWKVATFLWGKS